MSDPYATNKLIRAALLKGCLGGIGMAVVFLIISGAAYLLLGLTGFSLNLRLFFGILAGPLIGTTGLLAIAYYRARQAQSRMIAPPKSAPEPDDNG